MIGPLSLLTDPALAGAVIGVEGSLLTTLVTGLLSRDKVQKEKLWEKRQDACNGIIGLLRGAEPYGNGIMEGFAGDAQDYYDSIESQRAHGRYLESINAAHEVLRKVF